MPKYMIQASYVGEGLKGLLKEGFVVTPRFSKGGEIETSAPFQIKMPVSILPFYL
jgi:hypothetical protein